MSAATNADWDGACGAYDLGVDYGNGTAYAGLQMLEGAMPREAISTGAASRYQTSHQSP